MARILIFGDSIAHGAWDTARGGWADRLKSFCMERGLKNAELDYSVYNLGISGDNSNDLLERIEFEIKQRMKSREETIIVISIGVNDSQIGKIGVNVKLFKSNVEKLCDVLPKFSSEIIFIGLNPIDNLKTNPIPWDKKMFYTNERVENYNNITKSVCKEKQVYFIDIFNEFSKTGYKKLLEDGLHPNSKGHQKMFEIVRDFLMEEGIVK